MVKECQQIEPEIPKLIPVEQKNEKEQKKEAINVPDQSAQI